MYVHCVESFVHIECYSDCSRMWSHLPEPLCYGIMYVCGSVPVECCVLYPYCEGVFDLCYYVVVKKSFKHAREEYDYKMVYVFQVPAV